jgi:hypothetical protein
MRAAWLVMAVVALAACSYPKHEGSSQMTWQKTSELAPGLEDARQNCKAQTLAENSKMGTTGGAYVGGEFVKCMRAAGWALVEQ